MVLILVHTLTDAECDRVLARRAAFLVQLLELSRDAHTLNTRTMQHATRFIAFPCVIHHKNFDGCVCCNHKLVTEVLEDDACHGFSFPHLGSVRSVKVARSRITRLGISSSFTNRLTRLQTMLAAIKGV
jgi:hypothetical protein